MEKGSKKYVLGIEGEQAQERDKKKALKEKKDAYSIFFTIVSELEPKWGGVGRKENIHSLLQTNKMTI